MTLRWVVYLVVCAIIWAIDQAWMARRAQVQTPGKRRGVAPAMPLLPPEGNWCRCCGRETAPPWMWCDDCLFHVTMTDKPPNERTWYAQHGTIYPVPKPQRTPKPLPKPRLKSKRSETSGGHAFPKNVSLSRRAFIRRERCIATGKKTGEWVTAEPWMPPTLQALCPYKARIVCAHVDSRGAGHPDEANMVPLEWMLHQWSHQIGWKAFTGRLQLMSAKEIAKGFETRYQAANANYERGSLGRQTNE